MGFSVPVDGVAVSDNTAAVEIQDRETNFPIYLHRSDAPENKENRRADGQAKLLTSPSMCHTLTVYKNQS